MPHSIKALITPSLIKWAREQAGLDIASAAKRIGRPESEIQGWEDGTQQPTLAQVRKAADVYQRSLAVFYLSEIPQGFQTLRDFRHLPDTQSVVYSPDLSQLVRLIEYRQNWLSEWLVDEGAESLNFIGSTSLNTPAVDIAKAIRIKLGIKPEQQMKCKTRRDALNLWIDKSEEIGINICRQGGIECEEARGFVLTDKYAPFIYINSSDALAAQIFTLAHELVHLWINLPGISNMEAISKTGNNDNDRIEVFCNSVASLVLLDDNTFKSLWSQIPSNNTLEERISAISELAKVSEEVVARRLLDKNEITVSQYSNLRQSFIKRWKQLKFEERNKSKDNKWFPSPHLIRVLKNGRVFTRTVLSSYFEGVLSGADASNLLNTKINHFYKVAEYAGVVFSNKLTYE